MVAHGSGFASAACIALVLRRSLHFIKLLISVIALITKDLVTVTYPVSDQLLSNGNVFVKNYLLRSFILRVYFLQLLSRVFK